MVLDSVVLFTKNGYCVHTVNNILICRILYYNWYKWI